MGKVTYIRKTDGEVVPVCGLSYEVQNHTGAIKAQLKIKVASCFPM